MRAAAHLVERLQRLLALEEYQAAVPQIIARPPPQARSSQPAHMRRPRSNTCTPHQMARCVVCTSPITLRACLCSALDLKVCGGVSWAVNKPTWCVILLNFSDYKRGVGVCPAGGRGRVGEGGCQALDGGAAQPGGHVPPGTGPVRQRPLAGARPCICAAHSCQLGGVVRAFKLAASMSKWPSLTLVHDQQKVGPLH